MGTTTRTPTMGGTPTHVLDASLGLELLALLPLFYLTLTEGSVQAGVTVVVPVSSRLAAMSEALSTSLTTSFESRRLSLRWEVTV